MQMKPSLRRKMLKNYCCFIFISLAICSCLRAQHTQGTDLLNQTRGAPGAQELEAHQCYKIDAFELCVPRINQGQRVLARTQTLGADDLANRLQKYLKSSPGMIRPIDQPRNDAERDIWRTAADNRIFDVTEKFPQFVQQRFNTKNRFSGPNCYNSALVFAGLMDSEDLRHVSLSEFESYLAAYFERVETPVYGDVIVFDSEGGREHVATYLFEGLIFQKKGYQKGYGYRIVRLEQALQMEPLEWRPDDADFAINHAAEVALRPKSYFRLQRNLNSRKNISKTDVSKAVELANYMSASTFQHAKKGSIGSNMGTMMEGFTNRVLAELSELEKSSDLDERLAYQRLVSASYQIFIALKEAFYGSVFANSARINREHCWYKNEFMEGLVRAVMSYYRQDSVTRDDVASFIQDKVEALDREKCIIDLIGLAKSQLTPLPPVTPELDSRRR